MAGSGTARVCLPNGDVLVTAGGYNFAGQFLASAEIFHPDLGSWTAAGSLTTARLFHTGDGEHDHAKGPPHCEHFEQWESDRDWGRECGRSAAQCGDLRSSVVHLAHGREHERGAGSAHRQHTREQQRSGGGWQQPGCFSSERRGLCTARNPVQIRPPMSYRLLRGQSLL